MKNEKGYSLMELVIVIIIMGILGSIITTSLITMIQDTHKEYYNKSVTNIEKELRRSYEENGRVDTVGIGSVSEEVEHQIKHSLNELGVRFVNKTYDEIMNNGVIKEVNNSYLVQRGMLDMEDIDRDKWLVFDHIKDIGESNFKYYRNELFGKVINEEMKVIGKNEYIGALGEYKGEFGNLNIERHTDTYITFGGYNNDYLVKFYKGNVLIDERFGNGTFEYQAEDSVVEYKFEVYLENELIEERTIRGIPDISKLKITDVKVKEANEEGKSVVLFGNDFCLSNNSICLTSEEITLTNIDEIIIFDTVYDFPRNFLVNTSRLDESYILEVQFKIDGKYTNKVEIELGIK